MNPNDTTELQQIIDAAWEDRASLKPGTAPARIGDAVTHVLSELDAGTLRVAERVPGTQAWTTHQWIKKAVLLSFRLEENVLMENGPMRYFDKVPTKFAHYDTHKFQTGGFRVVPPAVARRGSFIGKNAVLMPSAT
jgi:2,3,4,5-tetrahydropyridine-2-carboxylate N-succinyltransferase